MGPKMSDAASHFRLWRMFSTDTGVLEELSRWPHTSRHYRHRSMQTFSRRRRLTTFKQDTRVFQVLVLFLTFCFLTSWRARTCSLHYWQTVRMISTPGRCYTTWHAPGQSRGHTSRRDRRNYNIYTFPGREFNLQFPGVSFGVYA